MQILGNFSTVSPAKAPCLAVVAYEMATGLPSFALIQESPNEVPTIIVNGASVETRGLLSDCDLESVRPNNGGGVIRRSCTITINTEHAKGYPYFSGPLTKAFYYGGRSIREFYFGIYAFDRALQSLDIANSLFFGYYQIESGLDWQELSGETRIPLIEVLINDETIVGATTESIPESFFLFNPWFDGNIVPKTFGMVPRIRLLNSFPSVSVRQIAGSINGSVGSNYTNASATIILERGADKSSVLRQLIPLGGTVRIKMHDGEVIQGSLSYSSITGNVTLTVVLRNTYYSQGQGYTRAQTGSPKDWGPTTSWPPFYWGSSVVLDGRNVIQDSNGYMQASIHFYDESSPSTFDTAYTISTKLTGWDDDKSEVINHDPWAKTTAPTFTYSYSAGLSGRFRRQVNGDVIGTNWVPGQHLYFANTTTTISLYFNNPDTSVAGSGSIGDPWSLVGITPASVTYECYIRNGFSRFLNTHFYCEGDGHLISIPVGNIVSLTQSTTVSGLAGMMKVVLSAAPIDMGIGAKSNVVYTDALYKSGANENRTESILYSILQESPLLGTLAGLSINGGLSTNNWMPFVGYVARGSETVTDVIDRICFQTGSTLRWRRNKFEIYQAAWNLYTEKDVTIGMDTYTIPLLPSIDQYTMYENSARMNIGKIKMAIDGAGFEYIPLYFEVDYGGWEDPFYKPPKQLVNRAIKPNERKFTYAFDLINDGASTSYAVGLALSIGHPSGLSLVERSIMTDASLDACKWEAMDPIVFKDFPLISTSDETNAVLEAGTRMPQYLKPVDGKKFVMGAVACVDRVVYSFSREAPKVSITAKMSQTFTNANGTNVYLPPFPPATPADPSNNPADPPGANSGFTTTFGYGGSYDPMELIVTDNGPIVINSTDPESCTITVNVHGDMLTSGGFGWSAAIVDEYATGAASLSGTTSGSVPDKTSDPYVNADATMTLTINYNWFPSASTSRPITIRFTRTIKYSASSAETYQDTIDHVIGVTLAPLVDIVAS